jgi:hypothetical protein
MVDFAYRSPILSVALDPNYARSKKRSFACGGRAGSLVLNVKGSLFLLMNSLFIYYLLKHFCDWFPGFFRSANNVIHAGEGPIYSIAWCGSLIAWANDIGIHILFYLQ